MDYQVGQILYICNENKMNIFPIQVVEEIIKTTLNGKERTYIVMLPDKEKTKFDITKVKDSLFTSLEAVRNHMIDNATNAINSMAKTANDLGNKVFVVNKKELIDNIVEKPTQNENNVQVNANDDIIMVDLGNGVKAKMNTKNLKKVANQ